MTITKRIVLLVTVALIGIVTLVISGHSSMSDMRTATQTLVNDNMQPLLQVDVARMSDLHHSIELMLNADRDAYQAMMAERDMLKASTADARQDALDGNQSNRQQVDDRMAKASLAFTTDMTEVYEIFKKDFSAWLTQTQNVMRLAGNETTHDEAQALSASESATAFETMREHINTLTEMCEAEIASTEEIAKGREESAMAVASEADSSASRSLGVFYSRRGGVHFTSALLQRGACAERGAANS